MVCPECHASCGPEDQRCPVCGAELVIPASRSLVSRPREALAPRRLQWPALLRGPVQGVAAGVGALAVGVGLELLRRRLVTLLSRPAGSTRRAALALPWLSDLKRLGPLATEKTPKLPRGYEIQETVIYVERVIRRRS
ncbi:hypothetical protein [Thermogemmatispora sp.]|uniref:hypothetical protein n=1 Tax=Thermogemmatispora sp. TaxID=1968838 RepID=UPI001D2BA5DC|nr:hypothetical protein [Thermogemmatispora sp.]MBX5451265.1 zinc ribbon domain-containing protein [Thermogemmatispora sp.]